MHAAAKHAHDFVSDILRMQEGGWLIAGVPKGILSKADERALNWHERECPHGLLFAKVMKNSVKVWIMTRHGKKCIYERFTR